MTERTETHYHLLSADAIDSGWDVTDDTCQRIVLTDDDASVYHACLRITADWNRGERWECYAADPRDPDHYAAGPLYTGRVPAAADEGWQEVEYIIDARRLDV